MLKFSIAQVEDIPQLVKLINSAYRGNEAKAGWTHEADLIEGDLRTDFSNLHHIITTEGSTILKCTEGNKFTGCVYLQKQGSQMYLGMLTVSPLHQGAGIGKQLLKAAESFAK